MFNNIQQNPQYSQTVNNTEKVIDGSEYNQTISYACMECHVKT
jgi:hypothetical protein